MAISVVMPALEMAQETGKLLAWRKNEGEAVVKGEPLLEIETDKVVVELEAPADGVLAGVSSHAGAVVPVGQTIAWIVAPGEKPPAESAATVNARAVIEQARPSSAPAASSAPASPSGSAAGQKPAGGGPVSPKARRIAKERGVDLSTVRGTGPGGTITGEDVLAAADALISTSLTASVPPPSASPSPAAPGSSISTASPPPAPATGTGAPAALSSIARLMAERTTHSWTQTPHFFLVRDVDASALNAARQWFGPAIERERGVKLTHTDLLVAIAARVLAKYPKMNASWTGEAIRFNPEVNISVAMAVKDGVVGAVIPKAGAISLGEIAVQRRDLTERARAGRLRPPDVAGGTFTISNLGMFGVDAFSAIITQPQAAVLAVGRIADRVVPVNGQPGIRPILTVTLSSDHRVVDGAQAAEFLNELAGALEAPQKWIG
jgi:pyruvate dehydrogenase E2 component (dihydrolipoamide acetyltransferase)